MGFELHNDSEFPTERIRALVEAIIGKAKHPSFQLVVWRHDADGMTITGSTIPLIVCRFHSREQFALTFQHEFIHLLQHEKKYQDEDECKAKENIPELVRILKNEAWAYEQRVSGHTCKV